MVSITPLETWIRRKARIGLDPTGRDFMDALRIYQLESLNKVIRYARAHAPFYRRHFASVPAAALAALGDMARIPFTTPDDLANDPFSFLAVRQDDIARIVTLQTSGSTGVAKRLFFTEEDLELTVDFFHHGMSTLVRGGQRVAVLLPGERPDSVGDLLVRGLQRMDVHAIALGPVADPRKTAEDIVSFGAHCLVGIPTQVLAVACSRHGAVGKGVIETVLLSTDYVPRAIAQRLQDAWGCRVFTHYGMTEMGLGGAVECEALDGYHLREADLYFEVVDHETGEPCPDGALGEIVFTTLTRRGMPLIRYRTGDMARILPEPCPCGSVLRRMERVGGRWNGIVSLERGVDLTLPEMDEALFRLPNLLDYRVSITQTQDRKFRMAIAVQGAEHSSLAERDVLRTLNEVAAISTAVSRGILDVPVVRLVADGWPTSGVSKRKIVIDHAPTP